MFGETAAGGIWEDCGGDCEGEYLERLVGVWGDWEGGIWGYWGCLGRVGRGYLVRLGRG